MMRGAQRFPYVEIVPSLGAASALPYVPLTRHEREVSVSALVDSGAALNVLPYAVGVALGADWQQQNGADTTNRESGSVGCTSDHCDGNHRSIRSGTPCVCVDAKRSGSGNPRASQLLCGIRCLLLPI